MHVMGSKRVLGTQNFYNFVCPRHVCITIAVGVVRLRKVFCSANGACSSFKEREHADQRHQGCAAPRQQQQLQMQFSLQKPVLGSRAGASQRQPLRQRLPCKSSPAGRSRLQVQAIAEAERTSTKSSGSMTPIQKEVKQKLRYLLGKTKSYDEHDIYQGTAWSVREHLIDSFENTHDYWE